MYLTPLKTPVPGSETAFISEMCIRDRFKYIGALIAVIALSGFAQSMLHSTWTLFTNFRFHWTPFNIGLSLVVMGLVTAVVQGFLLKKLLKLFGEQKLILYGLGSGALAYLCFGLVTYGPLTYLVMLCNCLLYTSFASFFCSLQLL